MKQLLVAGFLAGSALLGLAQSPPANAPTAAPADDTIQLGHGLNLAEEIEFTSDDGGNGHRGLSDEDFAHIHDVGFTLVRLPIQWAKHTGPAPGFTIDPAFFTKIDWVVTEAEKYHLQVVIDNHKDDEIFDDPVPTTDRFVAMWKQIAEHYKDAPPSILFELQNEPHKKLNAEWNNLFPKALAAVRASNPTRAVVIGCVNFSEIRALPELVLPDNDKHLIVTIHYYEPMKFTHQGSWLPGSKAWLGTRWGTDADKQKIVDDFKTAADWGTAHHVPIYLGEFGSAMKADLGDRLNWTRTIVAQAKAHGMGWTYWDYHGGFGPFDKNTKQWRQPLLDALLEKPDTGVQTAASPANPAPAAPPTASDAIPLGHGVNLGNFLESQKEGWWSGGRILQEDDFTLIQQAGFNLIRVPISWAAHVGSAPDFAIDPAFFSRVDWVVAQAKKNNLSAILDYHNDDDLMHDPDTYGTRFVAIWKQVAEHYKDAAPSISFELLNEPYGKLDPAHWNDLLAKTLPVIRASNPSRNVVVGPGQWNNIAALAKLVLPDGDSHLTVTIHFYDPVKFTHQGASWMPGSKAWLGTKWEGTDTDKQLITAAFNTAAAWGEAHHRPIYLGEFGAFNKSDIAARARWTAFVVQNANSHNFPWTYWEYCQGFGVYDPDAKQWRKPLLDALFSK